MNTPELVAQFLRRNRFAVRCFSTAGQAANAVYRKLRDSDYEVFPVNPNASELEGAKCYPIGLTRIAEPFPELPYGFG